VTRVLLSDGVVSGKVNIDALTSGDVDLGNVGVVGDLDDIANGSITGKVNLDALTLGDIDLGNIGVVGKDLDNIIDTGTRFAAVEAFADQTSGNTADDINNINGTAVGNVVDSNGRLANSKVMQPNRTAGPGAQASTAPVSAIDAGASATITISGHDLFAGSSSATVYSGGTITGLPFSTTFRVYADDADWNGGSVTYVAVTAKVDIAKSSARYWVATVTTPADGGGANPGDGGGGGPIL